MALERRHSHPALAGKGRLRRWRLILKLQLLRRKFSGAPIGEQFVSDPLALSETSNSGALDRADVDEHVLSTGFGLNEAKALGCVKPFNDADLHGMSFPDTVYRRLHCHRQKSKFWRGSYKPTRRGERESKIVWPKPDCFNIELLSRITSVFEKAFSLATAFSQLF